METRARVSESTPRELRTCEWHRQARGGATVPTLSSCVCPPMKECLAALDPPLRTSLPVSCCLKPPLLEDPPMAHLSPPLTART